MSLPGGNKNYQGCVEEGQGWTRREEDHMAGRGGGEA